jgi:hypothetical protein
MYRINLLFKNSIYHVENRSILSKFHRISLLLQKKYFVDWFGLITTSAMQLLLKNMYNAENRSNICLVVGIYLILKKLKFGSLDYSLKMHSNRRTIYWLEYLHAIFY